MAESYDMMILASGTPRDRSAEYRQRALLSAKSVEVWIDEHADEFNAGTVWFVPSEPCQCDYRCTCTGTARDVLKMPWGLVDVCHECRALYDRLGG